jgi:hypothetical protein
MADITKCKGGVCPLKESCYRYKSEADIMQSYFIDEPFVLREDNYECDYFWGMREDECGE